MDQKLSSIVVNAIDSLPESLSTRSDEYNENLSSIISRDEVRKFARGGQLSESKIGLIAVVVAIMQERIIRERGERIRDAKDENARAYAFLFGRMKNVWASTILSRKDRSKAEAATEEKKTLWQKFTQDWFTWGNVVSVAGAVAICSFALFSGSYANYKSEATQNAALVTSLQSKVGSLEIQLARSSSENTSLKSELAAANQSAALYKELHETSSSKAYDTTTEVGALQAKNQELEQVKASLEAKVGTLQGQVTSQGRVAESFRSRFEEKARSYDAAAGEIRNLQLKIAELKTQCGRKCEEK